MTTTTNNQITREAGDGPSALAAGLRPASASRLSDAKEETMYGRHYTMPWTFGFKATDNADRFIDVLWADETGGPIPFTTWEIIDEAVSDWAIASTRPPEIAAERDDDDAQQDVVDHVSDDITLANCLRPAGGAR